MYQRNVIAVVMAIWLALCSGLDADAYEAMVHMTELTDNARGKSMEVWLWGPSVSEASDTTVAGNSVFQPVKGRHGREFAPGRHPLLIMFHGTNGNTRSMAWLGSSLAARGYMVVSANHPGTTSLQVTQESILQSWSQAEDGSFLIDSLLASEEFASSIDPSRIGSIGFSLGGYSALAIAGVRLDIEKLQVFCRQRPDEETCKLFPDALYGPLVEGQPQDRDLTDPRIALAVGLAPGFVPAMNSESLSAIEVPTLVVSASQDEMLPVGYHARLLAGRMPGSEYLELGYASHFSFLGECAEGAVETLREEGVEFLCRDPEGASRRRIHETTVRYIETFLEARFNGHQ